MKGEKTELVKISIRNSKTKQDASGKTALIAKMNPTMRSAWKRRRRDLDLVPETKKTKIKHSPKKRKKRQVIRMM